MASTPPPRDLPGFTIHVITFLNVYRDQDEIRTMELLLAWTVPEHVFVAGDFNAHHHHWQEGVSPNNGAARIAN